MKRYKNIILALILIVSPVVVFADSANPDSNPVSSVLQKCTARGVVCGWNELLELTNAIVQYGVELIGMALVIVLIYTGFLYLTSGGDASKVKKAKEMLNKVMWGTIYTLCSWIIVYFIITSLGVKPEFYQNIIK